MSAQGGLRFDAAPFLLPLALMTQSTPVRIQLSRRAGWRKPENTVVVARPTVWGNPFPIGKLGREEAVLIEGLHRLELMSLAEEPFQVFLRHMAVPGRDVDDELRLRLRPRQARHAR